MRKNPTLKKNKQVDTKVIVGYRQKRKQFCSIWRRQSYYHPFEQWNNCGGSLAQTDEGH